MENKESTINKVTETLTKELESLSPEELREFFRFFYRMNHAQGNMIAVERFEEFLEAFDSNPFRANADKRFRKQLIDNITKYAHDHMSLITAAVLIKKKFTFEELSQNYFASVDLFDDSWY